MSDNGLSIAVLQAEWADARHLTRDLLRACSAPDLAFVLHPSSGPVWKQFRHIGRVHENYLAALETRQIVFDPTEGSYEGGSVGAALDAYFDQLDLRHDEVFACIAPDCRVDWWGEPVSVGAHLLRLLTHETLHHGQLMLCWRAIGKPFPPSWAVWGEG